jgi:hypothetical protein
VASIFGKNVYAGPGEPYLFGRLRTGGPEPERRCYRSFASFSDPDGNGWLFQEVTMRLAGRVDPATTTYASANDLRARFGAPRPPRQNVRITFKFWMNLHRRMLAGSAQPRFTIIIIFIAFTRPIAS